MIKQLNPPIPVITPKGPGLAQVVIDDGVEHDLKWVCFIDSTGESWTFRNRDIRAQKNITQGRDFISPFYDPDDVAFKNRLDEFHELRDENEKLTKDLELLQHTKNGLEKICRDQLSEIESLNETMESMARGDEKYSLNEKLVGQLLKSNKKIGDHARHLETQVYQLRKFFDNPPLNDLPKEENNGREEKVQTEVRATESNSNSDGIRSFENAARLNTPIVDEKFSQKIQEVAAQVRGHELKILDDFCKAYYAAEMKMTGKDFMEIANDVCLSIQSFYKDGQMTTKYWFSPKEEFNG